MRSCFSGSGQAWRSREVDQVDVPPALLSFILAPFAFGAHLLALSLNLSIAFYSSRRDYTLCPGSSLRAPSSSSTGTTVLSLHQVQIAVSLSQILTFSHARNSPCLVAFPPGHSVFIYSAKFPNKINAHLDASVERAPFESSFALGVEPCSWCARFEGIQA